MNKIKLGDVAQIIDGAHATPNKTESGKIYLGIRSISAAGKLVPDNFDYLSDDDFIKWSKRASLQKDDVVFSYEATLNRYAIIPEGLVGCLGRRLAIVRINHSNVLDAKWLYYYFQTRSWQAFIENNIFTGSTVNRISIDEFPNYTVTAPGIDMQKTIANVLSLLDNKIELNSKINAELEALAHGLYSYCFVQFEFPDETGRPYKTSGGAMVYSEELKCEIPANWQVETLYKNALTEIIKPKIDIFSGHKIYLDTSSVNDLAIGASEQITYNNRASRANMQPVANSVWFAKMKSSVKHVIVGEWSKDLIDDSILSTGFMGLAVKEHALAYLAGYIRNPYFEIVKDSNSHGATMSGIGNDDMKNIRLLVPTENVLREFSKSTSTLWQQIDKNRQENQRLIELRDWLLPMLMNGQVEITQ